MVTKAKRGADIKPEFQAINMRIVIRDLRNARNLALACGSPKVARRIRLAITSAGGALRHAEHAELRAYYAQGRAEAVTERECVVYSDGRVESERAA